MTATGVLDGPVGVNPAAPVARANPVTKLAVATLICFALLLTVDPVTAGVAVALELACLPWCGLAARALWRRCRVVVAGAVPAAVATALFGVDRGVVLAGLGPVTVTEGSLAAGCAIGLRVVAIGLPGVVLLATTDATDLADALSQKLRLPARFVLSALAAMRLFGVLAEEWRALAMARRARGLGDDAWYRRLGEGFGMVFALLVLAVRRATILATTMESRGFGVVRERTWARPSRFAPMDAVVLVAGAAIAVTATAIGVATGSWQLLLG